MRALNGLMLTYPVHQAADILFCRATQVPVGADQLPHIEQARTIARRFNRCYAPDHPVFIEPEALLSHAPALLGTDGRKMSKSRGNAIAIAASADETARLIRSAKTDPNPHITYDPTGRPGVSNLVLLTALCEGADPNAIADEIGGTGASELKRRATQAINERLRPIRQARAELIDDRTYLRHVLRTGTDNANAIAQETLTKVSDAMHTSCRST